MNDPKQNPANVNTNNPLNTPLNGPGDELPNESPNESPNDSLNAQTTGRPASDASMSVAELRSMMREFVAERQWQRFHNAKNLSMSLAIEAAELMEHFQWLSTDEVLSGMGWDRQGVHQQPLDMQAIREELADVVCYALSLANALEIDISQAVIQKMAKNRLKYPAPRTPNA